MLRAILLFALVLGIVIGGLMLLRRTANMQPSIRRIVKKPSEARQEDEEENEDW